MKLATWIVKLYPRVWRGRYEEEMLALLTEHPITFLTIFDLLFGMLDARLDPHYRTERRMFALKSPNVAVMAFFATFAAYLFLINGNRYVIGQGFQILFGQGYSIMSPPSIKHFIFYSLGSISYNLISYLLLFIAILIPLTLVRRIIAARNIVMGLFAIVCIVAPVAIFLLNPLGSGIVQAPLMSMLLLTILKSKQAIAARKKGMLFLIILIDALLILLGASQLLSPTSGLLFMWSPLQTIVLLSNNLFPFAITGMLLLMLLLLLIGSQFDKWTRRSVFITAGLMMLSMITNLVIFLIGSVSLWTQGATLWVQDVPAFTFLTGQLPIGFAGLGLLFSTVLILLACRSLFLASPRKSGTPATKDAVQELPAMEMQQ